MFQNRYSFLAGEDIVLVLSPANKYYQYRYLASFLFREKQN